MSQSRDYTVTVDLMTHTGGTKYYTLITMVDVNSKASVGLQVWGPNGQLGGHKFITGTQGDVAREQANKKAEKAKVRKGERYSTSLSTTDTHQGVGAVVTFLKSYLTPDAEHLASALIDNMAGGFSAVVAAKSAEEEAKANERKASIVKQRETTYANAWGSF